MIKHSSTLVLGTAVGFGVKQVWPFVESLRRFYDGDTVFLVTSWSSPELFDYLRLTEHPAGLLRYGVLDECSDCLQSVHPREEFLRECHERYDKVHVHGRQRCHLPGPSFQGTA